MLGHHQEDRSVGAGHPAPEDGQPAHPDVQRARDVASGEGLGLASVDDEPVLGRLLEVARGQPGDDTWLAGELEAALQVHRLHVREVGRPGQALAQLVGDEVLAAEDEDGVAVALDAERGPVPVIDVAAAHRARAVGREDERLVPQWQHLAVERVVEERGVLVGALGMEEVGAPGVPGEERVSGEDAPGERGVAVEEDGPAEALGGMARSVEGEQGEAAELEPFPLAELQVDVAGDGMLARHGAGAGEAGEPGHSQDEVLLPVRLEHVAQAQALGVEDVQVDVEVAPWVDHERVAVAAEHVGDVSDAGCLDGLEEHGGGPP